MATDAKGKTTVQSVLTVMAAVFMVVVAATALMFGYWWLRPYNPIEIRSITVSPAVVVLGDEINLAMDYCKHADDVADVELFLLNDVTIPLTMSSPEPYKTGCGVLNEAITIHGIPKGVYKLGMVRTYHPNPITWRKVPQSSNLFEVREPPAAATVTPGELHRATAANHTEIVQVIGANRALIQSVAGLLAKIDLLLKANAELIQVQQQQAQAPPSPQPSKKTK